MRTALIQAVRMERDKEIGAGLMRNGDPRLTLKDTSMGHNFWIWTVILQLSRMSAAGTHCLIAKTGWPPYSDWV